MRKPATLADRGGETVGIERALAVFGVEAEQAQDAQEIFADARARIADEAHASRREVGEARRPCRGAGRRASSERALMVKSRRARVGREVAAEADGGAAAVGLDVLAQRRHLEGRAVDDDRDGAVLDAGRHRP